MKALIVALALSSSSVMAQDQMNVRVNEQGILKILKEGVKYNSGSNAQSFKIPKNIYSFKVKKENFANNPIVQVVNEISNLNLTKDLPFYVVTSDIKIGGTVDSSSIKTSISNSSSEGFDLKLQLSIPSVTVTSSAISLCEDRVSKQVKCGKGLKATASSLKLTTSKNAITITAIARVENKNHKASVKLKSVSTNLESKNAPVVNITLGDLTIPKIAIVINDQETEIDTTNIKKEILSYKSMLGKELLGFAADFVAEDLVEMLNVYLKKASVSTNVTVFRHTTPVTPVSIAPRYEHNPVRIDNTYVAKPLIPAPRMSIGQLPKIQGKTPTEILEEQIVKIIRQASVGLSFQNIKTPLNKDIQIGSKLSLKINNSSLNIQDRLGNKPATLPALNIDSRRKNDANIVIAEPVINGALDLISKTGLFQELAKTFAGVQGFTIKSAQIHFAANNTIKAVLNSEINLKELESDTFGKWVKNMFAAWMERNNNKSIIYFPIEVAITPSMVTLENGSRGISLFVKSPFHNDSLINSYQYPSNVGVMSNVVKDGLMKELKTALGVLTEKSYTVDLTKFLNQSGISFVVKNIVIEKNAYLVIDLNISKINLRELK